MLPLLLPVTAVSRYRPRVTSQLLTRDVRALRKRLLVHQPAYLQTLGLTATSMTMPSGGGPHICEVNEKSRIDPATNWPAHDLAQLAP